jgi:hypothetical protein
MSKMLLILPFGVFSAIMSVMALVDFAFMQSSFVYTRTSLIWRYPSSGATLLGALWFGQVCAALLTPVALRYGFRIRQRAILIPWLILAGLIAAHTAYWAFAFINRPYDLLEVAWRTLHMPLSSLQTMTFATKWDYLVGFVAMQIGLMAVLGAGHGISYRLRRKR